jgi:hypothetical protein
MTQADIWEAVKNQDFARATMVKYLSRLTDSGEVSYVTGLSNKHYYYGSSITETDVKAQLIKLEKPNSRADDIPESESLILNQQTIVGYLSSSNCNPRLMEIQTKSGLIDFIKFSGILGKLSFDKIGTILTPMSFLRNILM